MLKSKNLLTLLIDFSTRLKCALSILVKRFCFWQMKKKRNLHFDGEQNSDVFQLFYMVWYVVCEFVRFFYFISRFDRAPKFVQQLSMAY